MTTEVSACWKTRCSWWWIFQQPAMIEPYFDFYNMLPVAHESLKPQIILALKMVFIGSGDYSYFSMLKVN